MSTAETTRAPATLGARCSSCAAPLAYDQRYCLSCGERRGPPPRAVVELIGAILEQGRGSVRLEARPSEADLAADRSVLSWMPPPRVAAMAVLGMLAFGVLIGSVVRPDVGGLARSIVVALSPGAKPASGPTAGGGAGAAPGASAGASAPASPSAPAAPAAPVDAFPAASGSDSGTAPAATPPAANIYGLPSIKHVFLVVLANHGFNQTFGPTSQDAYLSKTLPRQGKLIENYFAVGPSQLANAVALISGQGPTQDTAQNCPTFTDIAPFTVGDAGQIKGNGCVYPAVAQTVAGQLAAKHLDWSAYVEDMGKGPSGQASSCRRPQPGSSDPNQAPSPGDPYVTWRNPFVYFHSMVDSGACLERDVDLSQLPKDLASERTTAALSYVVPSPCHDGSEQPCAPGAPAGLAAADDFLRGLIPQIQRSPGYRDGGVIAITFDQAPQSGDGADHRACCGNPAYPNLSSASTDSTTTAPSSDAGEPTTPSGGGGQVGMLLISPFVKPGTADRVDYYNHFSMLATIEHAFDLRLLGYAADKTLPAFDASTFDAAHQGAGGAG